MKIYQIHETLGEYEDYEDNIVGTYLHKEYAERELERFIREEAEIRAKNKMCRSCPYGYGKTRTTPITEAKRYCNEFEYSECYDSCANEVVHWNDCYYDLIEVEVCENS